MYKTQSTKIPIQLDEELIRRIAEQHTKIVKYSKKINRIDTGDFGYRTTKSATIPPWN